MAWQARFWAKVNRNGPGGCWLWNGAAGTHGYGVFKAGERGATLAHRLSYELHHGPIPEGLFVCHRCDNPLCVNPAHLFLGTPADNVRDMDGKGRARRTGPASDACARAKLTAAQVAEIRALAGTVHRSALAARFGVCTSNIGQIIRREIWR